jgi:hypothetical protein
LSRAARFALWLGLVGLVCGCSTVQVESDWDPRVDFSGMSRYAWLPGPQQPTGDARIDNPLLDARLRKAIDAQLRAQGHTKTHPADASFLVGYHLSLDKVLRANTINDHYDYGYGTWDYWGGPGTPGRSQTVIREYETGTLVIDIIESARYELVWRGSGSTSLERSTTPEREAKLVARVVGEILKGFPPDPEQ